MNDHIPKLSEADAELLQLGAVLGQNHAFGLVAGRCSAAQAQALRQLRDERKYKRCMDDWRQFCSEHLYVSGAQADKIIALAEKYGDGYFELAQLTRISPQTYEIVAPAVKDGALHFNGEAIHLEPENARKVANAVAQLRRQAAQKTPARSNPAADPLADVEKRFAALLEDIQDILRNSGANRHQLSSLLQRMTGALHHLKTENGLKF